MDHELEALYTTRPPLRGLQYSSPITAGAVMLWFLFAFLCFCFDGGGSKVSAICELLDRLC